MLLQVKSKMSLWHGDGYEKLFQKHKIYVRGKKTMGRSKIMVPRSCLIIHL